MGIRSARRPASCHLLYDCGAPLALRLAIIGLMVTLIIGLLIAGVWIARAAAPDVNPIASGASR